MAKAKTAKVVFQLAESVISLQDLKELIMEIQAYARWYEHNAIKKQVHAKSGKSQPAPELSAAAQEVMRAWGGQPAISQKSLDQLITTLQDYEASAPQFTIILAAPPPAGLKKEIVAWCRKNISPKLLINFQFNSTLLGGMVVRCGSHIYDWSFRKQILSNAAKFPEVLRRA